jgi:hypothetical protein
LCCHTETDRRSSRVVIDARIPFDRQKTFPVIARPTAGAKWAHELPKGF